MPKLGKSSKKWPNPEKSTGELYKNVKLGRKECWEAVGDARQKFEEIASEIKAHLEKCSEPVANPVVWTVYMIGRNRQESAPTIMFCGRDKKAVTEIKELIKSSGIMDRYPAFRMGSRTEEFRHFSRGKSRKRHKRRRRTVQPCSGPPEEGLRTIQQSPPETRIETQMLHNGEHITTFGHDKEFWNFIDGVEDRQQTHIGVSVGAGKAILYSPSDTGPGMKIFIRGFHGDSSLSRLATGGGFISHRGSTFLTTVAHAFCEDDVNALPTSPETCNIEFELDDDSEEDDNMESSSSYSCSVAPSESSDLAISGRIFSDTTSEASNLTILATTLSDTTLESEQSLTISSAADDMAITSGGNIFPELNSVARAQTREPRLLEKSNELLLPVGEHYILSTTDRRPGLDYCLIEIEANELLKSKQISLKLDQSLSPDLSGVVMRKPRDVDVVAAIGSGRLLKGRLSGTPSFLMLPGRNLVQEVWTVRYGTEVSNGDCGAWVVDASNGDLFGHIVGGSPSSGVLYIIPAYLIIDDLVDRFDGEWKPVGVVPEPVVSVSFPAPVHPSPTSESVLPTRVLEPILPDPVLPPVVPDTLSVPGESRLRRSLYIKSMQSERATILVGASTFQVPYDLLVHSSTTFQRLDFLTTQKGSTRGIALPDVTPSTFEDFLIWLYAFEQILEAENIDRAFHLVIFAQKYQIYDLRNQASNLIRAALHDKSWTITPDILLSVYKTASLGSSLRHLCFLGFVSMESHCRSLDWKAVFLECPSLGWDYFEYKRSNEMYPGKIETGGACRFHDHSNIDEWKPQDVVECPYSFQKPVDAESGCGIHCLATVGHKRSEAPPSLPSLHMDRSQHGRRISLRSPASEFDLSDKEPRRTLDFLETRSSLDKGSHTSRKTDSTTSFGPVKMASITFCEGRISKGKC